MSCLAKYDSCTISASHSYFMLNGSNDNLIKGFSGSDISIHGAAETLLLEAKITSQLKTQV